MKEFNWYSLLDLVDYGIRAILIIVTAIFIYWLISDDVKMRFIQYKFRLRNKKQKVNTNNAIIFNNSLFGHIYKLIAIRTIKADVVAVYSFIVVEIFIGLSVSILLVVSLKDIIISLICAAIAMLIPYLYLYVSARNIRNEVGGAIQEVIQTLIHSYSASRNDMYTALKLTHNQLKHKQSQLVIARLISDLQTAHDEESMRKVVDIFVFSTGNSWGMRLGNIVLKGYVYQENVMSSLLTLQQQLITNNKMLEEEKVEANDLFATTIVAVIMFPVSIIGLDKWTNPQNYWHLQFGNPLALLSFVLCVLLVAVAVIVAYIIRKPKQDL